LLPTDVPGARAKLLGLGLKTDARGLAQQFRQLRFDQFAQRCAALAAQIFGKRGRRFVFEPQT